MNPAVHAPLRIGRPSKAEPFLATLQHWLADDPQLQSVELLRRAKVAGYDGAKSALYELVHELRPRRTQQLLPFPPAAGQMTQHDFAPVIVRYNDGSSGRLYFFATRLTWSRWVTASIIGNEQVDTLIDATRRHFQRAGGVPLLAVFDRPRVVARSDCRPGTVAAWNPAVAAMALELGVGLDVCWRHRDGPNGASDSIAIWLKGKFFKDRRFADAGDAARQLCRWLADINAAPLSGANGSTPADRLREEQSHMRPVRLGPDTDHAP